MPSRSVEHSETVQAIKQENNTNGMVELSSDEEATPDDTPPRRRQETRPRSNGRMPAMAPDRAFYRSDAPSRSSRVPESEAPLLMECRGVNVPTDTQPSTSLRDDFFTNSNSFRDIGRKLKACNDTLGELQQLGVHHDVSLPELVLVGDQSAGKSSLMSGLADLSLPRSEGTCTRCPTHIRLSRSPDFACRVSLQRDWEHRPPRDQEITEDDVTEDNKFPPWVRRSSRVTDDFKTVYQQEHIEEVLRWAQIAILNDQYSFERYVPGTGVVTKDQSPEEAVLECEASFSPNIVALSIQGPDLPDLSFYDMPGIFQSAMNEKDQYLSKVVQYLAREYISHPAAIIICAIPMNQDAEVSSSFNILRGMKALPRTIGVLTKADLLPKSSNHTQWLQILRNKVYQTGLGYVITSRPPHRKLEDMKTWESHFFEPGKHDDWPKAFHEFSDVTGVEKLKDFLSNKLGQEFAKSLPMIKHKVAMRLNQIQTQLRALPELPENVHTEVRRSLLVFSHEALKRLEGPEFQQRFNPLPGLFRDTLLSMKPTFILKHPTDNRFLEISDDESDAASVHSSAYTTPKRPANSMQPPTGSKRQRAANGMPAAPSVGPRDSVAPSRTGSVTGVPQPFVRVKNRCRSLQALRDEILKRTPAGMQSTSIPFEVFQDLGTDSVRDWHRPTQSFVDLTVKILRECIEGALSHAMGSIKKRLIYKESKAHLDKFLQTQKNKSMEFLLHLHELEKRKFFTTNDEAMKTYIAEERERLEQYRYHIRWIGHSGSAPQEFVEPAKMNEEQRRNWFKQRETRQATMGKDPFSEEVAVAAKCKAYYRIAALRFVDEVSMEIDSGMVPCIKEGLAAYLDEKLGLLKANVGEDAYMKLMDEDSSIAERREKLKKERERFEKALESIRALEMSSVEDGQINGAASTVADTTWTGSGHSVNGTETDNMDGMDGVC